MSAYGAMASCSGVFMAHLGCSWLLMYDHECLWVLTIAHKQTWFLMSRHYHPRGFMGNRQGMAPWWKEKSWALVGPKKLFLAWCREHTWTSEHHKAILLSAPKCSLVLRSAPECTWMVMIAQLLDSTINKKNVNYWNDLPVVFWPYLVPGLTK